MRKVKRSKVRRVSKILHAVVVAVLVLQPVGTPGILGAYLALGQSAADAQPASSDSAQPVTTSADQPKDTGSNDASTTTKDKSGSTADASTSGNTTDSTSTGSDETPTPPSEGNTGIGDTNPADTGTADGGATQPDTSSTAPATDANGNTSDSGTISPEAASTDKDIAEKDGKVCLAEGAKIDESRDSDWSVNGDTAETKGKVELGVKYVFPGDDKVSVTFTCLPAKSDDRTKLKIEQIRSEEINLPEGVQAATEYAYDITTGMKDGDFEYDLTLPKSGISGAEINYIEKSANEVKNEDLTNSDLKSVDNSKVEEKDDSVKVEELDHFTIYIYTYSDSSFTTTKTVYAQGETVYMKATGLSTGNYYRFAINPPGSSNTLYLPNCQTGSTTYTSSYVLPTDAVISNDWKAEIHGFSNLSSCNGVSGYHSASDDQAFEVIASKPDLTATKTHTPGGDAVVNQPFTWTIRVQNSGSASATFYNGKEILRDERSSTGVTSYGSASATAGGGASGNVSCLQSGTSNRDLTCTANGTVTIPVNGYFDISFTATPSASGSLSNPRSGATCKTDRGVAVTESNENNNNCNTDIVNVSAYQVTPNPSLPQACGLDIALVLDNSTSISSSEMGQMKSAMTSFTNALAGTPTQFSVTKFATTANVVQNFTNNITNVNSAINGIPVGGGYTNWEDGLTKAQGTFDPRSNPNLVIFASDGNPNTIGNGPGNNASPDGSPAAMNPAITVANSLKSGGTRILAIGIGTDLNVDNMKAISGPNANTGNVLTSDVITTDFPGLAAQLATFAQQTCGGTITVNKYYDSVDQDNRGGAGWQYNIAGTSKTTDTNGQTDAVHVSAGSGYSVTETNMLSGYSYGNATCKKSDGSPVGSPITNGVGSITIGNTDIISCDFVNTTNPVNGALKVHKTFTDSHSNGGIEINVSPGSLSQNTDGNGDATFSDLTPGTYSATATEPEGYYESATTCDNVNVVAGQTAECTITDSPILGTIIVHKTVIGGTATPSQFCFTLSPDPASIGEVCADDATGNVIFNNVPAGTYSVNETSSAPNYTEIGNTCSNLAIANNGDSQSCTITNTRDTGDLKAIKVVDDESDLTQWSFALDGGSAVQADAVSGEVDFGQVTTLDNHTVVESGPAGYHTASISCSPEQYTSDLNAGSATTTVIKGGTTVCTFSNEVDKGSITIIKDADPNDEQNFTFGTTGRDLDVFTLDDNGDNADGTSNTKTFSSLYPGDYSVTEDAVSGWDLTNLSCTENGGQSAENSTVDKATRKATLTLEAGESITCTFMNTKDSFIIVDKVTDPAGDPTEFDFTPSYGPAFVLADADMPNNSGDLDPGTYSVAEAAETGWDLISATCSDSSDSSFINLAAGETATCTFTNTKKGHLIVNKVTDPTGDTTEFPISVSGTGIIADPASRNITGGSQQDFEVTPGTYSVAETVPTGWEKTGDTCQNIAVAAGETRECTLINVKYGSIIVEKQTNPDGVIGNFIFTGNANGTISDSGQIQVNDLLPGTYTSTETDPNPAFDLTGIVCDDANSAGDTVTRTAVFNLEAGETVKCIFTNTQRGAVTVTKYRDDNGNGTQDGSEPVLPDWDVVLDRLPDGPGTTVKTDENGQSVFGNLTPSQYKLYENLQTGWIQTNISCDVQGEDVLRTEGAENSLDPIDNDNDYPLSVEPGADIKCAIGNKLIVPKCTLKKFNNKFPNDQFPGADVTYTLLFRVLNNGIHNAHIIDLPPAGFKYRGGSWKVFLNGVQQFGVPEPQYHSPGDWDLTSLGTLNPDDEVKLEYTADISSEQDSGLYKDLAWARGLSQLDDEVLANSDEEDPFVGTEVNVVKTAGTVAGASVEIEKNTKTEHEKKKTERVTKILPATGYSPWWIAAAILILLAGAGFIYAGKRKKKEDNPDDKNNMNASEKLLVAGLIGVSALFGAKAAYAATANISARMEDPRTPVNTSNFLLGFVALDRLGREMTVECFANDSAVPFQTFNLIAGGASGDCAVDTGVVPADGTYKFHIRAAAGSDSVTTPDVSVEVITGGPGTPANYQRTKVSNCENNIKATTANDGKTARVEIYRSTERTFTADAGTLVAGFDIGPNEQVNYTDTEPNCGDTYYYAVRAFDALGNGSGTVADERTVVRTTGGGTRTITTTITAPGGGAIPAAGGAVAGTETGGATGGEVAGVETPSSEEQAAPGEEQGEVLGEEKVAEEPRSFFQKHPYYTGLGILIILAIIYYAATRKKKPDFPKPPKTPSS